jgi:hypothetical protein
MAQGGALAFEAARNVVRTLKLGSQKEWLAYSKSGKRPSNIPSNPDRTYRDAGWVSWPDWLGYGGQSGGGAKTVGSESGWHGGEAQWLSFKGARTFARTLKLGSEAEWRTYCKSGKRPSNIPSAPAKTYRDAGWVSMPDWLGYEGKEVMANGGALSFEAARTFARTLKLAGWGEWREYSKSGKRPSNIPSSPITTYRVAGWVSMADWLGYEGKEVMANGGALSFEVARTFVRSLKLRSSIEWREYRKSGKRPSNIPSAPDRTYRDAGWVSMPDWLGYGSAGGGGAGGSSSSSSVSSSSSPSSSSMQNAQRAGEHNGCGGRKEKPTEDPDDEAPPPKKMKLGSASGAASGGARGDISFGGKDGSVMDVGGGAPQDVSRGRIGQV